MKRLFSTLFFAAGLLTANVAWAAEKTVTLAVANMSCVTCPPTVKKAISAVPGVTNVVVSLEKKTAVVTFDDQKTTVEALAAAATNAGFPSKLASAPDAGGAVLAEAAPMTPGAMGSMMMGDKMMMAGMKSCPMMAAMTN